MKIKLLTGLILLGIGLFAQESMTFKYRLDYEFAQTEYGPESHVFGKHYLPEKFTEATKNSLLDLGYLSSMGAGYGFTLLDGNQAIQIQNSDLDNNFVISNLGVDHYYGNDTAIEHLYDKIRLEKFDREMTKVLDYSCNHYQLFIKKEGMEEEEDSRMIFCIDESNPIDNTTFLFPKQEGTAIKGLILSVSSPENDPGEMILLTKINKINSTIKFDVQKELAAYEVRKDSLDKIYESYNHDNTVVVDSAVTVTEAPYPVENYTYYNNYMTTPEFCNYTGFYDLKFEGENSFSIASTYMSNLCSHSYYLKKGEEDKYKKFALKEIKSIKKNYVKAGLMPKKDAELFYEFLKKDIDKLEKSKPNPTAELPNDVAYATTDAAAYPITEEGVEAAVDNYDVYVTDYESTYKVNGPETSNFAITSLEASSESPYWKGMPTYCKKIDASIPDFKDEDLKSHAKNYAGQICDMYLGEFDGAGVWYKGTLDAIRAEQLYFHNNSDKFSKKDKELLNEFLNSLD